MPIVKRIAQHKMVLDTHVWIWLMTKKGNLSKTFLKALDHLETDKRILISPMSVWEIGMLSEKGRVVPDKNVLDWIEQALAKPNVYLSPITLQIAVQSTCLPGEVHGDPVDRILIATAHVENAVLVTADQKLLDYAQGKFISAYDPC